MNASSASRPTDSHTSQVQDAHTQEMLGRFFGQLDQEAYQDVVEAIVWVKVPAHEYLVKQGDEGDSMYILIEGLLEALFRDEIGQEKKIGQVQPGESVGEMAIFTGEARSASIVAREDCLLAQISKVAFDELLLKHPLSVKNVFRLIITRLKGLIQAQLEMRNQENAILLKEIHHRVKNNLQVISSLLNLQSASIDDPVVRDAVRASQHRVKSMALIHQNLYQRENLDAIEMKEYMATLGESIMGTFGADRKRIQVHYEMEPLLLKVDTAVPVGLIVNELLTNALKYAFPDGKTGNIRVKLALNEQEKLVLDVSDDGVGMDPNASSANRSFGTRLVDLLRVQLDGKKEIFHKNGTHIRLTFNHFELPE